MLLAIALFFLLDITKLFGDVTGSNARKAIEIIRQQNEKSGDKAYKPSPVNMSRGKLTDKISPSGYFEYKATEIGVNVGTQKLPTTDLTPKTDETMVLESDQEETTLLNQSFDSEQTTILCNDQTTGDNIPLNLDISEKTDFTIDVELGFAGSLEIIE